jgi:hypothetical protein
MSEQKPTILGRIVYGLIFGPILYILACGLYSHWWISADVELSFTKKIEEGMVYTLYETDHSDYRYVWVDEEDIDWSTGTIVSFEMNKKYKVNLDTDGARTWTDFFTFGEREYVVDFINVD